MCLCVYACNCVCLCGMGECFSCVVSGCMLINTPSWLFYRVGKMLIVFICVSVYLPVSDLVPTCYIKTVDAPPNVDVMRIGELVQMVANSTWHAFIWECAKYNINITCTRYVHGSSIKFHTQIVVPQVRCAKSTIPRTMSDIRVLVLLLFVCIFQGPRFTPNTGMCACVCVKSSQGLLQGDFELLLTVTVRRGISLPLHDLSRVLTLGVTGPNQGVAHSTAHLTLTPPGVVTWSNHMTKDGRG